MKYKHYIFDFDGMLADSYNHIPASLVKAIEKTRGITLPFNDVRDAFKIGLKKAFEIYNVTEDEGKLFRVYEHDPDFKPLITPFIESVPLLKTIKENGGYVYIYTDRLLPLEIYLDRFGFRKYVDGIKTHVHKPDPEPLIEMLEEYHLDKKDCVVLGDRAYDVDCAYKAGVDGILFDVDSRVFNHHANYVVKRINDIYKILDIPYRMLNNYHTHTIRCGHAIGSDEEYVIEGIKAGYSTLAFSDHINHQDHTKNESYFEDISLLKERYKENIDIKISLECEYIKEEESYLRSLKENKQVDFLLLGNHYSIINGKEYDFALPFTDISYLNYYYESLKSAIETGLFKYICHPDVFLKGYRKWDKEAMDLAVKIAKLLHDNNCYAELSASGIRSKVTINYEGSDYPCYPFKEFYRIMKQYNVKCVLGADAHSPNQLHDEAVKAICDMAKELNLDVVYEINDL